jgi:hypothetical protein
MRKLLQIVIAGLTAVSFGAIAQDNKSTEVDANTKIQGDAKTGSTGVDAKAGAGASTEINKADKKKGKAKEKRGAAGAGGSGAGPTDNPNVTRDAQGREHVNKGKHTGQMKDEAGTKPAEDAKAGASSGSTSGTTQAPAPAPAPAPVDTPKKAD